MFYNKLIIFLYMFRALLCSSSLGQNCIIHHLVSSHPVDGRTVHRLREDLCTGRPSTEKRLYFNHFTVYTMSSVHKSDSFGLMLSLLRFDSLMKVPCGSKHVGIFIVILLCKYLRCEFVRFVSLLSSVTN